MIQHNATEDRTPAFSHWESTWIGTVLREQLEVREFADPGNSVRLGALIIKTLNGSPEFVSLTIDHYDDGA